MKTHTTYIFNLALAFMVLLVSCKDHELEDFKPAGTVPTEVSSNNTVGNIIKGVDMITVPLSVTLSKPASKAFQVRIQLNTDTVNQLIENDQLEGAFALEANAIVLPNIIQIPFGASTADFEVSLSVTALERLYGKKVAMAFNLVEPGKGNKIGSKGSGLVILNTLDILKENEIHYLSFVKGGDEILEVRNRRNYVVTSAGLTIPLDLQLAGVPGKYFSVNTKLNSDTIASMVAEGLLPDNTITLNASQFNIDTVFSFSSNTRNKSYEVSLPWDLINQNQDKHLAFAISIDSSNRHLIDERHNQLVVLIYPTLVVEVDVTNDAEFSVSRDNNSGPTGGEGSLKLIDNSITSKFLQSGYSGDLWFKFVFDEPQSVGAYTFTSGGDAPERDPKNWNIEGSMDGQNWTQLDRRTNMVFSGRRITVRYDIENPIPFTHFRVNITANNGNSLFQLSELRLIRTP